MIGQTISHYKILGKLGEGGMGVVYKALNLKLDTHVALKFLPPHLVAQSHARKRFISEAQTASSLEHPNICVVHDIDQTDDGRMFIVMPCYEGETLQARIENGPLDLDEALDIVSSVASGLAKAHQKGIIHRDIKPSNIFITEDSVPKIVDFGLAKTAEQTKITRTGTTIGTVAYMSPEQARGNEVDSRSDVFSLGVVLYELLTGKQPFHGDHEAAVLYSIIHDEPEPLHTHRSDLSEDLQHLIDKALAKDLAVRYESAVDLLRDLEQVRRGETVSAVKRPRVFPLRTVLIAAVGAAFVVAAYLLYTLIGQQPVPRSPAVASNVIAVFPFSVRGDEDLIYMGQGMVDLLSVKLDDVGELRTVDPAAMVSLIKQNRNRGELGVDQYRAIAERAGAGLYMVGSIVAAGGRVSINASLFETEGGQEAVTDAAANGQTEEFLSLVDQLAADLVVDRIRGSDQPNVQLARRTTSSFAALKAYLQAESLYRAGEYGAAAEASRRAVAADSTFALAYIRMIRASMSSTEAEVSPNAREKAMQSRHRLPENERRLLEALVAWHERGDAEEGLALLRRNISERPDDLESRCLLGELLFHYGRRQGLWLEEARANFERILYYDPDHLDAISQLHWLSGLEGKYEECTGWLERRLALEAEGDHAPALLAELAFAWSDPELQEQALDELRQSDDMSLWFAILCVSWIHGELEGAGMIADLMTDPSRPPASRAEGFIVKAQLAVTGGRWQEADYHLMAAEPFDADWTIRTRANLSLTPPLTLARTQLEAFRQIVLGLSGDEYPNLQYRPYLAGLFSARLGDYEAALRYASELDSIKTTLDVQEGNPESTRWPIWTADLARTIRAEVAWLQGNLAEALTEIEQTNPEVFWTATLAGLVESETYQRYLRGVLLAEMGRHQEALRWLGTLGQGSGDGFVFLSPKHLEIGKVYEKMGDQEKAIEHFGRFLELWQACEQEYRPLRREVEERVLRLKT